MASDTQSGQCGGIMASWHACRRCRVILDQSGGACHVRPNAVPVRCRAAELCADVSPFRPLRLETEARQLRLGQSAITRGPAAPAAELSPAATTCAAAWHSDAVLLPEPFCGPTREDQVDMGCTWRCAEAVGSSPQITSTQPGDQSPCLHCLSMQTTVVCVGACVPAFVHVRACARA